MCRNKSSAVRQSMLEVCETLLVLMADQTTYVTGYYDCLWVVMVTVEEAQ